MPRETPGASLELRGLTKRYDAHLAVDDVSLEIQPGEFITLLGPSGSGKTTSLNMIAGFATATSGEILMDGQPIAALPPHKRDIGMVFQQYALFPHMTAAQNVGFPLRERKVSRAEIRTRVRDALAMVGLEGFDDRYPAQMSGGQQQRVALARALVFNPRVLLMDEPLGALDRNLRERMQLEIKRIHKELGITFVFVTHDQEEALVLSDRIAIFCDGRIAQVGTADELYESPAELFVARFMGESNVFAGRVAADGREVALTGGVSLRVDSLGALSSGDAAAVVVRPERVHVENGPPATAASGGDRNVIAGTVDQEIYLGSSRKLTVDCGELGSVIVRESAEHLSEAGEGDRVTLSWAPDAGIVLADDGAGATARPAVPQAAAA